MWKGRRSEALNQQRKNDSPVELAGGDFVCTIPAPAKRQAKKSAGQSRPPPTDTPPMAGVRRGDGQNRMEWAAAFRPCSRQVRLLRDRVFHPHPPQKPDLLSGAARLKRPDLGNRAVRTGERVPFGPKGAHVLLKLGNLVVLHGHVLKGPLDALERFAVVIQLALYRFQSILIGHSLAPAGPLCYSTNRSPHL